ncbi:TetR/AcrR family transcriptional regulator [Nocardiopsis nanhaiensis]
MPTTPEPAAENPPGGGSRGRRRAPGPRRRLSRELIVETAVEMIKAEGLSALSMRKLADRLGVAPGTLYTYVDNRTALETLVLETVIAQDGLPHELPGTWWQKLEAWARSDWAGFRENPWVLELRQSQHDFGPASVRWLDSALRIFEGTGLPEQVKLDMIDTLDSYVRGAATLDVQSAERSSAPAGDLADESMAAYLAAPALRKAVESGAAPFSASRFDFGLRCLLSGFRAMVEEQKPEEQEAEGNEESQES